ncbi:MAG: T9SS type A sorting domain-containing protein [Planctomycetes bacterium]|nr:T9SS type A sorting domain-containing protein [Planctomycetota bacterium]
MQATRTGADRVQKTTHHAEHHQHHGHAEHDAGDAEQRDQLRIQITPGKKPLIHDCTRRIESSKRRNLQPSTFNLQSSIFNLQLNVYPNQYTGKTEITYIIEVKTGVTLEIYNVLGKKIQTIVSKTQNAGKYKYMFSGSENGNSSGIFILKLIINDKVYTKQLVELK